MFLFFSWWPGLKAYQFCLYFQKSSSLASTGFFFFLITTFCLFLLWPLLFPLFWLWALFVILSLIPLDGRLDGLFEVFLISWFRHVLGFIGGSDGKESVCNAQTQLQSLGWEDPLEKGMVTHSSVLAWRILWTEEPGGLQSMELQSVGHDWATKMSLYCILLRLKMILDIISISFNFLRLILWTSMWSILENILCTREKNIYSVVFGWNVF